MSRNIIPAVTLNDGNTLPAIGFGTYPLKGAAGVAAILSAIDNGYRLLDSACNYENEATVGMAVRKSGIARSELRITSKLPGRHHKYSAALLSIEESLYRAQLDYYDLYLIHWPNPSRDCYCEAWQALIEARDRGWLRSIGVSNFLPEHLQTLISQTGVTPAINQIEMHPYFPQQAQRAFHQQHAIVTEGWGPLGRGSDLLQEASLTELARTLNRSVAQVILRWYIQQGVIALPKSASPGRQKENLSLFDFSLSPQDIAIIDQLAKPDGRIFGFDPASHEEL